MTDLRETEADAPRFDDDITLDLPPPETPRRGRDPKPDRPWNRRLPVWAIIAAVACVVAVERLTMITFVTNAGPELLALSGAVFFGGNALLWVFGTAWLWRKMEEARPRR